MRARGSSISVKKEKNNRDARRRDEVAHLRLRSGQGRRRRGRRQSPLHQYHVGANEFERLIEGCEGGTIVDKRNGGKGDAATSAQNDCVERVCATRCQCEQKLNLNSGEL